MRPQRLRARWLVPVRGEPVRDGALLVDDSGRIVALGPDAAVPRPEAALARDLGEAALLPGLVNTHTHLELTALRGLVPGSTFPRWVQSIRRIKDAMPAAHFLAGARWGVLEHFAHGITTIGDTGSTGVAARAMAEFGARGVAYQEVFGPDSAACDEALGTLAAALRELDQAAAGSLVTVGVSPHAPYTVSERLAGAVASLARIQGRPLAMHLAESAEEHEFVAAGTGPFADHLRGRGIAVTAHGISPVAWALRAGLDSVRPLLIHCVHTDAADAAALAGCGAAVAHCPVSNQLLNVGRAPLPLLRDAGVTVGLGTDSVAAGNSLDLFLEARQAALGLVLAPRESLALITADAAHALGLEDVGRLAPGAWADLCAVSLEGVPRRTGSIEGALVAGTTAAQVQATWIAGRLVYERGTWPGVDAPTVRRQAERAAADCVAFA